MPCAPAKIVIPRRRSLLTPELAEAWVAQVGAAYGGMPAWSAANLRRLLTTASDVQLPLILSLAPEAEIDDKGRVHLVAPSQGRVTFDPRRKAWEAEDAIGWGIDGLAAKLWRVQSPRRDLGPLDGATGLAACLGLAVLRTAERRIRRER